MAHSINWFEIPVSDFQRGKAFYDKLFNTTLEPMENMGMKSAFFPADLENNEIGGCIVEGHGYEPSSKGALVYLNGGDDLDTMLSRVESAGGKIIVPKTAIPPHGFMAHFEDSEGNKIGLHSMG
jgi:predicted enzyme related to lactoylglutathione lyase